MKFNTNYSHVYRGEISDDREWEPSQTEQSGWLPPGMQIERFVRAGVRLDQWRREQFDFGPDDVVPDDAVDPTRSPGFDMADASEIQMNIAEKLGRKSVESISEKVTEREYNKGVTSGGDTDDEKADREQVTDSGGGKLDR